jgi:4-hydroxythreonine-4-phosphate dehydrogenase
MGDVAGIGPEVIARAWSDERLHTTSRPLVIGSRSMLERAISMIGGRLDVTSIDRPEQAEPSLHQIPCLEVAAPEVAEITPGQIDSRAGRAAYQFLLAAIDLAMEGQIDAITTLPLNKESLRAAGVRYPGHTEILGWRCGVQNLAMMLHLSDTGACDAPSEQAAGLGVVHATLHVPLRAVFELLTIERILQTIELADAGMRPLTGGRAPRVAVAGLNPHAGENGLFGDEELSLIAPAVARARSVGVDATGPIAADTLFARALSGEFDSVVAMYHDQGHVALKTIGFDQAVNVTLGLPIVRTSVAHGTAFDIAWQSRARPASLIQAVQVAARLVAGRRSLAGVSPPG